MAPFEDSVRVPLIVHAPAMYAARRITTPVSLVDLAPTLAELGGAEPWGPLDGTSLVRALAGDPLPMRDLPLEYLAEGVRSPQVSLVRGGLKLIRSLGEPDLVYDVEQDPGERVNLATDPSRRDEVASLREAADERWDLAALDGEVRASQEQRRLVARALATGQTMPWDHPAADGPYIRTGMDFWETLERARRV